MVEGSNRIFEGTLEGDEQRVLMGVIVEPALDVAPLLELVTRSCLVGEGTKSSVHSSMYCASRRVSV